jgi:sterol desaturase/sphingolipid hydroxylase (fatty acid hydroxylase superfamily)
MMEFNTNLLLHAAPAMVLLGTTEFFLAGHEARDSKKNLLHSVIIGVLFLLLTIPMKTIPYLIFTWIYKYRVIDVTRISLGVILLCVLADDFCGYWAHRLTHSVRFFWASHLVHHSSETYNLFAGVRQSWVGIYTGTFLLWAWMPLFGFAPELMVYIKSISTIYQFLLHTETVKRLPRWIEYIFNTPSHHRVHHSSDFENLDKNCGAILILFDRIFGTFRDEGRQFHHNYGLTKKIENATPVKINFNEFGEIWKDLKKSPRFHDKYMYIFGPPGWSHDGSTQTVKQMNRLQMTNEQPLMTDLKSSAELVYKLPASQFSTKRLRISIHRLGQAPKEKPAGCC